MFNYLELSTDEQLNLWKGRYGTRDYERNSGVPISSQNLEDPSGRDQLANTVSSRDDFHELKSIVNSKVIASSIVRI